MPFISRQQAEALQVLDWLYSEDVSERASGRSFVQAIALLRKACTRLATWCEVRDHWGSIDADRFLINTIRGIAEVIDIRVEVDNFQRRFCVHEVGQNTLRFLTNGFVEEGARAVDPEAAFDMHRDAFRGEAPRNYGRTYDPRERILAIHAILPATLPSLDSTINDLFAHHLPPPQTIWDRLGEEDRII